MSIDILAYQNDIRAKAKSTHIPGMEWEDVYQELMLHLYVVRGKYDLAKSSPRTFVVRVATNKIRDLVRRAHAQKRGFLTTVSLDALIGDGFDVAEDA